ncbi:hypothetical protein A3K29_03520 [Candidatus Collierbacteria bacterium RIFOXYB2_FULL_46_14]|uniref:Uncharacterized protein n=1 Tax=Candidatus Collierbacteria bacterium GW2011_GWA2_46_26 TaxID=1618381 RepID=A0A0G1SKC5_9BACT|nr:MAG: hypothetical protein UW29_C0004G0210 [Candidatus Collierbacteria bacterium GW2011_GWC2_44_13]KKU33740.1 MAG: hypothetical protein UX47_C0001G0023 [Candidatus Collierbacteria bacterium GW2011_GWA2_46_26]OGD73187.1 MAG: hypothetical protein A3K29_03520 [Candidatus Collierbacteria bacterium RIFOXYB2_FULL_46_14]OGD76229.1 MAG: hypothetical protein A3K43_03520 [Candidatus Collierbacteria bacterium RIFOXYA2_FULL_46_20]OGD77565.1 MAG: hypothetical protein A3K39_03520 [Candidatus Collierbacteri
MASLQEKLRNVYGGQENVVAESRSWIPKRMANNPYDQLKRTMGAEGNLSPKRTKDMMEEQELLGSARDGVFEAVAVHLLTTYGSSTLEVSLQNFQKSWDTQFERYGTIMVVALSELTNEMKFVNHDGWIRKVVLRNKVAEIKKREKNQ